MAELQTTRRSSKDAWIRGHVMTRFFATVWWVVMVFFTFWLVASWIQVVVEWSWRALVTAVIVSLIFVPVGREWPSGSRMWRMLRHGT